MVDKNKRRQYLIDKSFQLRFILKVYLAVFITLIFVSSLLFIKNDNTLSYSAYQQVLNLKTARDVLLPNIITIAIITAIVSFVIIFLRYLTESHRIAGPLYRLKKVMEQVSNGDLTTNISIRERDEMQGVKRDFNDMVSSLNQKVGIVKKDIGILSERLKELLNENVIIDDQKKRAINSILEDIKRHCGGLKTE